MDNPLIVLSVFGFGLFLGISGASFSVLWLASKSFQVKISDLVLLMIKKAREK